MDVQAAEMQPLLQEEGKAVSGNCIKRKEGQALPLPIHS